MVEIKPENISLNLDKLDSNPIDYQGGQPGFKQQSPELVKKAQELIDTAKIHVPNLVGALSQGLDELFGLPGRVATSFNKEVPRGFTQQVGQATEALTGSKKLGTAAGFAAGFIVPGEEGKALKAGEELSALSKGARIAKNLQPLAEEARKYKSAEEFVSSIGKTTRPIRETQTGELVTIQSPTYGRITPTEFNLSVPREGEIVKINPSSVSVKVGNEVYKFPAEAKVSAFNLKGFEGKTKSQLTDFYNQATKVPPLESGGSIPRPPGPIQPEVSPSSPLPSNIPQLFKYVKSEPLQIGVGANDAETARGIRENFSGIKNSQIVRGNQLADEIRRAVPNKLDRQGMFWWKAAKGDLAVIQNAIKDSTFKEVKPQLERALNLPDNAKAALAKGTQYYNEAGQVSHEIGTIKSIRENYQNRIYTPEPPRDFVKSELKAGVSTYTSHAKQRVFDTEFDAVKGGKTFATTDFADALSIHNEEMARVNTAAKLYQALPDSGVAAKVPLGQTPNGWQKLEGFKQFPQTEEVVAPKGIANGLRAITDPDFTKRISFIRTLSKYQGLVKTVDLAYSFFHHFTMAMQTIYQGVGRDIAKLPIMDKILASPDFNVLEQDFVKHTGMTSNVQVNQDILRNLTEKNPDVFSKITNLPMVKQALNIADKNTDFLFGRMQRMFKVQDYGEKVANWVYKHPNATDVEVRATKVSLAKEVNNVYGGLNWEAMGMTKSNLSILRTLLLAPDWTISNIELARQAFGNTAGGAAARASLLRGIVKGMVITEVFNKALTGHFTDQNPKGHGLEVEAAPNVYISFLRGGLGDIVKWGSMVTEQGPIAGTARFAQGKLAPFPRTGVGIFSGTRYTGAPIAKRGAGPLEKTIDYLEYFGQNAGPVPFGISNTLGSQTNLLGKALTGIGVGRYSALSRSSARGGSSLRVVGSTSSGLKLPSLKL